MIKNILKILFIIIFVFPINTSAQTIIENSNIKNQNITWDKTGSPYIIRGRVNFSSSTLNIIDAEVVYEFGNIGFYNNSNLNIKNSNLKQNDSYEYFISVFNSIVNIENIDIESNQFIESYNSSIFINSLKSIFNGNKKFISLYDDSNFSIANSNIQNYKGIVFNFSKLNHININKSLFINNKKVIDLYLAKSTSINKNDFDANDIAIESFMYDSDNSKINIEDNYFQSDKKIYLFESQSDRNEVNRLIGPFNINIYSKYKNINNNNCCSNIIFLPGIMGSRLYKDNLLIQNQLWEPNRNTDVKKLYLDKNGKSVNNIYTKDIINKTNILGGLSYIDQYVYKDFTDYLNNLIANKTINSYKEIPYDWRLSFDDILNDGVKFTDTNVNIIDTIKDLQKTSKTNKVTIITHSNGGLLAKKILLKLKQQGLDYMIDNVIFVAMPEYGTPQAITSLLYGHNQSILGGLILKSSIAKNLGKNMSTAYTLLPSEKYYYYSNLNKDFHKNTLNNYNDINYDLLNKAKNTHNEIDNIEYSKNINIYQIIGIGLNTVSDIYLDKNNKIKPIYDKNGDGVVQDLQLSRYGTTTYIDLNNTKYNHMNIMNYEKTINSIDNIINIEKNNQSQVFLDYNKIIKDNNYKLIQLTKSTDNILLNNNNNSDLNIDLNINLTERDNKTENIFYLDKYIYDNNDFNKVVESSNKNRFELYDNGVNYIHIQDINSMNINSKEDYMIDINVLESVDKKISQKEYKNIPIFKDVDLILRFDNSDNLNINLPSTNQNIVYTSFKDLNSSTSSLISPSTIEDNILDQIISDLKSSKIDSYLKDRYIRRMQIYKKNKDKFYLISLKKNVLNAINSIKNLSYSKELKARYVKTKEYYIYLNSLLLRL